MDGWPSKPSSASAFCGENRSGISEFTPRQNLDPFRCTTYTLHPPQQGRQSWSQETCMTCQRHRGAQKFRRHNRSSATAKFAASVRCGLKDCCAVSTHHLTARYLFILMAANLVTWSNLFSNWDRSTISSLISLSSSRFSLGLSYLPTTVPKPNTRRFILFTGSNADFRWYCPVCAMFQFSASVTAFDLKAVRVEERRSTTVRRQVVSGSRDLQSQRSLLRNVRPSTGMWLVSVGHL